MPSHDYSIRCKRKLCNNSIISKLFLNFQISKSVAKVVIQFMLRKFNVENLKISPLKINGK